MITSYTDILREQTVGEIGLAPKEASKLSSEIWQSYRRVYPERYAHSILIPSIFAYIMRGCI